ncbi:MAG: spore germination protein, partial [Clostridia bacterium]|nr:spore germination protein [Clostridia bacterium]
RSNETLYSMPRYTFGKIAAKIIVCILALFLFYAAFLPIIEQKLYVQSVFYDTLPSNIAFSSFFLLSAYLCAKPLTSSGRVWDILAPVSIVGYAGILILSIPNADFGALQPVGAAGAQGFFGGTAYTMCWFFDSAIFLTLIGHFKYEKGMAWKGALAYLAGGAAIILFLAVFYGIFSDIAVRQLFAFSKTSKYFSGITVLGRIDYLFLFALTLVMAFYVSLPLRAGVNCLEHACGAGKYLPSVYAVAVNLVLLILSIILDYKYLSLNNVICIKLFWIFPIFCIALPLLALLLRRSPRDKIS